MPMNGYMSPAAHIELENTDQKGWYMTLWTVMQSFNPSIMTKHTSIYKTYLMLKILYLWNTEVITILSWASAHGCSQLKCQNWGGAVTQRRCLNGSTIPTQGPTQDAKLAAKGYQINLHRPFIRTSLRPARQWRKLDHATKWPTRSHVAKFAVVSRHLQYTNFMLQGKNTTDGCVRTIDAWCHGTQSTSEQLQLCELSRLTFGFTMQNLAWWAVTRRTSKNTKLSKLEGGRLPRTIW